MTDDYPPRLLFPMDIRTYETRTDDTVDSVALQHKGDLQITAISLINTGGGERGGGGLDDNKANLA